MAYESLSLPLAALLLGLAMNPVVAAEENPVGISKKKIEEKTAGLHVRQPEEEEVWLRKLPGSLVVDPAAEKDAQKSAKSAVSGARTQDPLVQTYTQDIWTKLKSEFESKKLEFDADYLSKLVTRNKDAELYETSHVFVFVSESVPLVTLKNYQQALEGIKTTFVLRGMIGDDPGRFVPTQEWVQRMLCGDPPYSAGSKCFLNSVDINPNLFRMFGIERVPALVYVPDPTAIASCGQSAMPEEDFLIWYGDLAPSYVFDQFSQLRPADMRLTSILGQVRQ